MRLLLLGLTLFTTAILATDEALKHRVYSVNFQNDHQAKVMFDLERANMLEVYKLLKKTKSGSIKVAQDVVLETLKEEGIELTLEVEDLEQLVMENWDKNEMVRQNKQASWWESFHTFEEINAKLNEIAAGSADVELEVVGSSYEGRDIIVTKVCRDTCGSKPGMFIQTGIHAREWIGPASVSWMLNELVNVPENDYLIESLDWYFMMNVNPDGYEYTWTQPIALDTREWRKTRSPQVVCVGVDANRNYDFCWNTGGTSDNPCDITYHGTSALSEVETQASVNFATRYQDSIKFFNDVHSFSELILLPYGVEQNIGDPAGCDNGLTPDADERFAKASAWNDELFAVHNERYAVGNVVDLLYEASGGSFDHMLGVLGIKYSIGMELRPPSGTIPGFIIDPDQIIPTGEEIWAFHKAAAEDIIAEFVP